MELIKNTSFEGERPLFANSGLRLEGVTVFPGESALKECKNIEAFNCEFQGKYPFWHNDGFVIENCLFKEGARAARRSLFCRSPSVKMRLVKRSPKRSRVCVIRRISHKSEPMPIIILYT